MKKALSLLMALVMTATFIVSASAAAIDEKEPNNDAANATVFTVADTVSGKISDSTDEDWYCFTVANASLVTVKLTHSIVDADATSSYFDVTVYDSVNTSSDPEASFSSKGNEASTSSIAFSAAPGKHYIKVTGGRVVLDSLTYSLSITADINALAEKEPNNTAETATALELSYSGNPKRYIGSISTESDVDYYKFTIPEAGFIYYYIYNTNGAAGEYNAELVGYVSGNDGVAQEKALGTVSLTKDGDSVMSPSVGLSKGDYYIKVSGSVGGYQVRVFFSAHNATESEYNGELRFADQILTSQIFYGSTFDVNDTDMYKFVVSAAKTELQLVFDVKGNTKDGRWNIYMVDASGNVVAGSAQTALKGEKVTYSLYDLKAGTYYIVVNADASAVSTENYKIYFEKITVKEEEEDKSFIDQIKDLNWSKLLSNFSEWIGQINLIPMLQAMFESIKNVIGSLF